MKKLLLTAGICIATLMGVQAQQTTAAKTTSAPGKEQMEKIMNKMTSTCNLTPDQVTKVKPIVAEFIKAKAENKEKAAGDKDKMKTANQASAKAMNAKLATVLNADQQTKWIAVEKEMKAEKEKKAEANKK